MRITRTANKIFSWRRNAYTNSRIIDNVAYDTTDTYDIEYMCDTLN